MSWFLRRKKERDVQIDQVRDKVVELESRVDSITEVLIKNISDPWALGILRSIHDK